MTGSYNSTTSTTKAKTSELLHTKKQWRYSEDLIFLKKKKSQAFFKFFLEAYLRGGVLETNLNELSKVHI